MSGIVLSASVRQNLLSLQSTAALLATTQNDLSTGNKVNTALDNPTNYFTAQEMCIRDRSQSPNAGCRNNSAVGYHGLPPRFLIQRKSAA